jgi:P2 family phage contractile tail tube protein
VPNPLLVMEKANLFVGKTAADESNSNHLIIAELKLPMMDEQYVDHRAGGAPLAIEIDTIVARLEATFVLAGWTEQVATRFYSWDPNDNWFTAYGAVRDRDSGDLLQAIALMRGRLGRVDPVNWRNGELQHFNYSIRAITHYELMLADASFYIYDFFNNTFMIGGVDQMAAINGALLTGSTNVAPIITGGATATPAGA